MDRSDLIFWTLATGIGSALATGLGAIPVGWIHRRSKKVEAFAAAVAGGMMISASVFSLMQKGISLESVRPSAPYEVISGLFLGALFFWAAERFIEGPIIHSGRLGVSRRGLLVWLAMTIHSIPEGVAIGVGFATGDFQFGLVMALAISVHNIPEGIAVSLPLRAEGASIPKCAFASILSSAPQPIMAVPAALAVWLFQPLMGVGLGFAGGAMIYLVVDELIPTALEHASRTLISWGVTIGLGLMLLLTTLLDLIGGG